jgi:hypothetical protein
MGSPGYEDDARPRDDGYPALHTQSLAPISRAEAAMSHGQELDHGFLFAVDEEIGESSQREAPEDFVIDGPAVWGLGYGLDRGLEFGHKQLCCT